MIGYAPAMDRFDVAIISERPGMRISPQGVRSIVQFMSASGWLSEALLATGEGWEEVFAGPGISAHGAFHDGPSRGMEPVFLEMGFRYGQSPLELGYAIDTPVHFFLEFRGAAFDELTDEFLERVDSILYCRPCVATRLHEGLRSRDEVAPGPDPRKKRPDRSTGKTGIRVEEL